MRRGMFFQRQSVHTKCHHRSPASLLTRLLVADEAHLGTQWLWRSFKAFIADLRADAMRCQQFQNVIEASAGDGNMARKVLAASDDAWLVVSGKAHHEVSG
jgi:hypothetical protein